MILVLLVNGVSWRKLCWLPETTAESLLSQVVQRDVLLFQFLRYLLDSLLASRILVLLQPRFEVVVFDGDRKVRRLLQGRIGRSRKFVFEGVFVHDLPAIVGILRAEIHAIVTDEIRRMKVLCSHGCTIPPRVVLVELYFDFTAVSFDIDFIREPIHRFPMGVGIHWRLPPDVIHPKFRIFGARERVDVRFARLPADRRTHMEFRCDGRSIAVRCVGTHRYVRVIGVVPATTGQTSHRRTPAEREPLSSCQAVPLWITARTVVAVNHARFDI